MNKNHIVLYDGECAFCRRSVDRLRSMLPDAPVEFLPYQENVHKFSQLTPEACDRALQYIDPEGRVTEAAEAVFKLLAMRGRYAWIYWLYRNVTGFSWVSERVYRWIANNRKCLL